MLRNFARAAGALSCLVAAGALAQQPAAAAAGSARAPLDPRYARDPDQPIDVGYGAKIAQYTTAPEFNTALTDYLPKSDTVPTPAAVLGDVAGAPNHLPYVADVHRYFRLLAEKSPRVRVYRIGRSEEGREMIAVAVADEALLADLDANRARLADLADPRRIGSDDARADALIAETVPVYYITAAIHSNETGSPTSTMELAYRLAVDDAPYIAEIRSKVVTLITPVVEVDGRDRQVDVYNWHRANPGKQYPPLIYWGKYVAHDNNRDAMGLTLNLTRNVLDTYVGWKAIVLHDLHESVPFLYDNTVGAGPYNAWVDPILVAEWQQIGWDNVQELGKLGLPGVYTHGEFDTWSPGYLMFLAALHNGVSRLYETFGNGGADTVERQLDPEEYSRTWYRPDPPYAKVLWSQRNNNNYTQAGLLTSLSYFARHDKQFLRNFWLKSKRALTKPNEGGPAAYVFPADDAHASSQAALLRVLRAQHVEVHRTTAPSTASVPYVAPDPDRADAAGRGEDGDAPGAKARAGSADHEPAAAPKTRPRTFPPGSFVVRMDQPYSRIADALLDRQYWAPDDPQKNPYDDTGWSFGDLYGTEVVRVVDAAILAGAMERCTDIALDRAGVSGEGDIYLVDARGSAGAIGFAYAVRGADVASARAAFEHDGKHYRAGTLIVRRASRAAVDAALKRRDLRAVAVRTVPRVATRPVRRARVALMHTWYDTQTEGWWRMALDRAGVPYDYISTQDAARLGALRGRYDVILFGPSDASRTAVIVDGLPRYGNAMPWKKTALTPNLGGIDETDDIRPGLGAAGVEALKSFVEAGGLLITSRDTARFAIDVGLAPGVKQVDAPESRVAGSILAARRVGEDDAVTAGYDESFAVYSPDGSTYRLARTTSVRDLPNAKSFKRPTGRGGAGEIDAPQSRRYAEPPALAAPEPWESQPLTAEESRNNPFAIPPGYEPRALVRYAEADGLLLSGLLDDAGNIAERAVVVDARYGEGHTLLFAINPLWRGQTVGNYALVFNAILHHGALAPGG